MTEAQIKHMTERFLRWGLPENFNPDCGVSFEKFGNYGTPHQYQRRPTGMNLLSHNQAEAMIRHLVEGLPSAEPNQTIPS